MSNNTVAVFVKNNLVGYLKREDSEFIFTYQPNAQKNDFISLTMPVRSKSFSSFKLHPVFEMNLPEGYLLSVIKRHFSKIIGSDDFAVLQLISNSVNGRINYNKKESLKKKPLLVLADITESKNDNLFDELLNKFALQTAISGVQPKVLAPVENKLTLSLNQYIVKAWGEDYPELALNEFLCMTAVKKAGICVPEFYLSTDEKLFIMKRFDLVEGKEPLGFEDLCVLQAKQRDDKYKGSYEQIAKSFKTFVSPRLQGPCFKQYFKMIVMNTFLENGDAHLKNFGVLYENINEIKISPAYDIVCTTVYIKNDIPALMLNGTRRWHSKEKIIAFGVSSCFLTKKESLILFEECLTAMKELNTLVNARLKSEKNLNKQLVLKKLQSLSVRFLGLVGKNSGE